jgi:hypothetical protein
MAHLFEGLVVDEARSILGHLELALLDVLAELPGLSLSGEPPGEKGLSGDGEAHMVSEGWGPVRLQPSKVTTWAAVAACRSEIDDWRRGDRGPSLANGWDEGYRRGIKG